jgi:signal recognition particle receptor subunit beta
MGSGLSDPGPEGPLATFKILIAGGFGAGKTTFVGAISEVRPLRTEEALTSAGASHDDLHGVENKTTTTVAMDFGRITLGDRRVLYLFGTPGQERFWFMWDDLSYGALGAVVLADTRRLADCFASIDYFEKRRLAFVVAINCFDGAHRYDPAEVRAALDLRPGVPVVLCDARQAESAKHVLIALVELILDSTPDEDHEIRAAPAAPAAPPLV